MKALVIGKNKENEEAMKKLLQAHDFKLDGKKPDVVFSLGGDGTYLVAEAQYPSVPKLLVRDSNICNKCERDFLLDILKKLKTSQFRVEAHLKLEGIFKERHFSAANDIVIRNKDITQAIRFALYINGKQINGEFVGDGIVVSTPFGSTAYFYSITERNFTRGIGIAFNNLTLMSGYKVVNEDSEIMVKLLRNDADIAYDNTKHPMHMKPGDKILIRKSARDARIIKMKTGWLRKLKNIRYSGRRISLC